MTLNFIMNPERAARIAGRHALDPSMPGLNELIDRIFNATWKAPELSGYKGDIGRVVDYLVLQQLMSLSLNKETSVTVRAAAGEKINALKKYLSAVQSKDAEWRGFYRWTLSQMRQWEEDPGKWTPVLLTPPDGAPLGTEEEDWTGR
jgi:hypothetical protein